jgi:tRNA nucleotidyltransferase (CCA-adding enzyme)
MTVKTIKQSVLRRIKPGIVEEDKIKEFLEELTTAVKKVTDKEGVFCGSIGKHTWLKGDHDIDLFIIFPTTAPREELEKEGLEIGKKVAKELNGAYIVKYAEHPYVMVRAKGFMIDIVPCYGIKKKQKIRSAVDRSPLHKDYVEEKLHPSFRDDVRLLKQFCKGIGVYGSDTKTEGVSGYTCELLVIQYGKFEDVLKEISAWNPPQVVILEKIKGVSGSERKQNMIKMFKDPLILIDPVDEGRNVAANLNAENFIKLVRNAGKFIYSPKETYLIPDAIELKDGEISALRKRGTEFFALKLKKPGIIDDTLIPQLRKAGKRIEKMLEREEFSTIRSLAFSDGYMYIIYEMNVWKQPVMRKMEGPPVFVRKHSAEFLERHKHNEFGPYINEDRWAAEKPREFTEASEFFKLFLAKPKEEMIAKGIPDNIAGPMKSSQLLESKDFWVEVRTNEELSVFLKRKYFDRLV